MKDGARITSTDIKNVFDTIVTMGEGFTNQTLKGDFKPTHLMTTCMTVDNNLAFYDEPSNNLVIYGLLANKIVQKKSIYDIRDGGSLTRLVVSQDGQAYLLGFDDGAVMRLNTVNLKTERIWGPYNGAILDIWGNETLVIATTDTGYFIVSQFTYTTYSWTDNEFNHKSPLEAIKVSQNLQTICFFCKTEEAKEGAQEEEEYEEYIVVYSLVKDDPETFVKIPEVKIDKIVLDIEDDYNDLEAQPSTIYGLLKKGEQIYVRDEKRTGVKIFSAQDGSLVAHIADLHKKAIYQIKIFEDNLNMITVGRDKVLKTTQIVSQECYNQLYGFSEAITALALTEDQCYAFVGDKNGNVYLYHTNTWQKLCKVPGNLEDDFGLDQLQVSQDSTILLA